MTGARSRQVLLLAALVLVGLVLWRVLPSTGSAVGAAPSSSSSTMSTSMPGSTSAPSARSSTSRLPSARTATSGDLRSTDLRTKARAVLAVVDRTGAPPKGYVGGRRFMNDGRGGTAPLPRTSAAGRLIIYHEYDVNRYREGTGRGPQRLVVGDDGSAYCTPDHYESWIRLR